MGDERRHGGGRDGDVVGQPHRYAGLGDADAAVVDRAAKEGFLGVVVVGEDVALKQLQRADRRSDAKGVTAIG